MKRLLLVLVLLATAAFAQPVVFRPVTLAIVDMDPPGGACSEGQFWLNGVSRHLFGCRQGVWHNLTAAAQALPVGTQPTCGPATRGTLFRVQGALGVEDRLEVCVKLANDTFAWQKVRLGVCCC